MQETDDTQKAILNMHLIFLSFDEIIQNFSEDFINTC